MAYKQNIYEKLSKCLSEWLVQKSLLPSLSGVTFLLLLKLNEPLAPTPIAAPGFVQGSAGQGRSEQNSCDLDLEDLAPSSLDN